MSIFPQTEAPPRAVNTGAQRPIGVPTRDVRRRRPPVLSLFLRLETLRRICRVLSLLALDFIGVSAALTVALLLKAEIRGHGDVVAAWHQANEWTPFAYLVTVLLFARADLYADRPRRPGIGKIATALFQATVISLVFALATGDHYQSYYIFFSSLLLGTAFIGLLREGHLQLTGWLLTAAGYERRAVLVGSGAHLDAVGRALTSRSHTHTEVVGYVGTNARHDGAIPSLGTLEELPRILVDSRIQELILTDPEFPQEHAVELVDLCHQLGVTVQVAPSTMEILIERADFVPGETVPLFRVRPLAFSGIDFTVKRCFDLVIASAVLVLSSPLLLAIAIAVKVSSRGPVIYRSFRPGIGGTPFQCLKFRTMREHADQNQDDLESLNEQTGALFKIRNDPRTTTVGRALRQFSLDELPQLVNVLRGEMSLVGPRPLPLRDYERLADWHKKRYLVLPGITGLWQVSGRSELDFDDLVRLDFLYVERWSILLDLSILMKTIPAVLTRRGAF